LALSDLKSLSLTGPKGIETSTAKKLDDERMKEETKEVTLINTMS
jgi:hypothetical protein